MADFGFARSISQAASVNEEDVYNAKECQDSDSTSMMTMNAGTGSTLTISHYRACSFHCLAVQYKAPELCTDEGADATKLADGNQSSYANTYLADQYSFGCACIR